HRDALYIGKGAKELVFVSNEASRPAKFYYNCAPAHTAYPTKKEFCCASVFSVALCVAGDCLDALIMSCRVPEHFARFVWPLTWLG
ncbi:hypothetical protein MJM43_30080, partial [Salmonella enterica subsp. enterica serovar Montevideo]|nr:hypothetical protein [Salmonella enterica subsp. enterica serovar Montevideo]